MTKLKLSSTLSEDDLRRIAEWSARERDSAKERGRREGIEGVAVWLEGKMQSGVRLLKEWLLKSEPF